MIQIDIDYRGDLRCIAAHQPSEQHLTTDAPTDNQGRGEAFSPTDLLATATGTCMLTIMGILARDRGWNLAGTRARIEKHMSDRLPRRVARLIVDVTLPADLPIAAVAPLTEAALGCPVMRSINPEIVVEHRFERSTS